MNKIVAGLLIYLLAVGQAWPQAALLPNAKQTFLDNVGNPLAGGKVYFYVPGSTNKKTTWLNSDQTSNNTNPVILDSAGRAVIYGQGNYRQVVQTSAGVQIWDALTTAYGSSSPSGATGTDTAPVGSVMPWASFVAPTNWQFAYGQAVSRTDFPDLLTAITISDTSVNCTATSTTLTGFADTSQIRVGAPIEATCMSTGITVASIVNSTTITISSAATSTATVTATVFPWGNGDGVTTFNVPDFRGRVPVGAEAMGGVNAGRMSVATTITTSSGSATATIASATGIFAGMSVISANVPAGTTVSALSGTTMTLSQNASASASGTAVTFYAYNSVNAPGSSGGSASHVETVNEMATHTHTASVTDPGHVHAVGGAGSVVTTSGGGTYSAGASGGSTGSNNTNSATTGISVTNADAGSAAAQTLIQPSLTVNYIIKTKPNATGAGGVVSWGGLTGDIATDATLQAYTVGTTNYAGIADASDLRMLANVSGGTAQPLPTSNSEWLDATCGSSKGMIIYRGTTTWDCLPAGTNGQALSVSAGIPAWATLSGTGTVTDVSVVTANGFSGTVATSTSTPAITLATTVTGFLQGNGTAISAASTTGSGTTLALSLSPTISDLTVTGSFTATGLVDNSALVNPATTVNGQTCTLGSTCTVTAAASSIVVGNPVTGGTAGRILGVGSGPVLSEFTTTGSGTVVALATSPNLTTPSLGVASATSINKVAITAPATSATLTIADGKTATFSNTLTLTGTDSSSIAFGTGGTVAYTIASGTKALATSAITTGTCTSAQTATATNTLTTDTVSAVFASDPTGVTGYSPTASGMLTIIFYPTANTVNFKVCNNTAGDITPGAISINWRVTR